MSRKKIYLYSGLLFIAILTWLFSASGKHEAQFSETVKIALRDVGNQLLLVNKDSTSLVLPVLDLDISKYQLSFQNNLSFKPSQLVTVIEQRFIASKISNNYIVEVIQCSDGEVAYSYKITQDKETTIIPCAGRLLPESCYTIKVTLTDKIKAVSNNHISKYIIGIMVLLFLLDLIFNRSKQKLNADTDAESFASIGSFQFYPEQNKLVKKAKEISLSKKECELLAILVASPNKIIKRDELEKRVWEDNGVVVGRSLDTYISKLRKKLKEDDTIKITNVHGVGYKLEVA